MNPAKESEITMASVEKFRRAQSAINCGTIAAKSNIPAILTLTRLGRDRTMFCPPIGA